MPIRPRLLPVLALAALLLPFAPASAPAGERPAADPVVEARVADLLARMSLEEKVGQMFLGGWSPQFDDKEIVDGVIGILSNTDEVANVIAADGRARAVRHGIPLLFSRDIIHGYRTLFPMPLGIAATFDEAAMETAALHTAKEGSAQGLDLNLGPMLDLSRDARWGRVVEGPGEDPFLARRFAAAAVRGLEAGGMAATLKHFVGYGAAESGRDYNAVDLSESRLRDLYLPPFKAGIDAGAQVVMAAFNTLNGVPGTANRHTLTDILRKEWGFDGIVMSDWDAVRELVAHGVAADEREAVEKAVMAGVDVDMASGLYRDHLVDLVKSGRVPMARIDEAVSRVLRVKMRLGLFEPAAKRRSLDPATAAAALARPETREAARDVARRSVVLLKNDDGLLPLVAPPKRIAVIGAMAADAGDHMGAWGALGKQSDVPLLLDELRSRLAAKGTTVDFAAACDDACRTTEGFDAAVKTAAAADLVVAVLGEPWWMTAESTSRTRLGLPNHQQALLDRLAATGRPVLLVVFAGRPMVLRDVVPKTKAILWAYSPGTMGGAALTDLILGEANPSGRLPMSMPRAVGQVPISYDRLPTGRPWKPGDELATRYVDEEITPLFPFGFGLSYTSFTISPPKLAREIVRLGEMVSATVTVTNTGTRAGRESVQLYVHDVLASRSRPRRELKAFAMVDLAPGESREVVLEVPAAELGFHDDQGRYRVEPGRFEVFVGADSDTENRAAFTVVE
jgi:beta-glucosidase